jgi:DNA-binding NarL/FixJ family response regulator
MNAFDRPDGAITRILIVDDHPLVRAGLKALIAKQPDLMVCGEAEDRMDALQAVATTGPHLVLVDLILKQSNGLELIKDLRQRQPRIKILVISMHDEQAYAARALKAGAQGYVMKREPTDRIVKAIRTVLRGHIYLSDAMTQRAVDHFSNNATVSPAERLSDRELELFRLTGQGKQIAEIAEIMSISPRTVEVHRSHIKKKLKLKTSTEIFQSAYEWLREADLQP